jgi:hypothetical protein
MAGLLELRLGMERETGAQAGGIVIRSFRGGGLGGLTVPAGVEYLAV